MYIETINSPEDVKKLTIEELPALTEEMRHALLTRASRHGGHFGPNFGMVKRPLPCIMYLNRRKIKLYMTFPIRVIRTKC